MKNKNYIRSAIYIMLFVMAVAVFSQASFIADTSVLTDTGTLDCPIYMTVAENNNKYIINKSMTQILILDENNNYKGAINGGRVSKRGFNFANNFTVDADGNVYVSDVVYNSSYDKDKSFRILKFSPTGKYIKTIYEKEYVNDEDMLYIHSACMSLDNRDGRVYFAQREFDEIVMYSIAADGSEENAEVNHIYPYANAGLLVFDIAMDLNNDLIYFTDKKGNVYKTDDAGTTLVYHGGEYSADIDFYEVPNCITISNDSNKLYYTDIGRREVFEIDLLKGIHSVVYERDYQKPLDECPIYYRIGAVKSSQQGFAVCSSGDMTDYVIYNGTDIEHDTTYNMSNGVRVKYIVLLVCVLILAFAIVRFCIIKLIKLITSDKGEFVVMYILIFIAIATIFAVTTTIILNNTGKRYNERVQMNMYYISNMVSDIIDGDAIEKINSPDDYMNDDYISVRNQLHMAFKELPDEMQSMMDNTDNTTYCVLYRMKNDVVYYTMHLSDDDGVIYPDEYAYEDSDYKLVKDTMQTKTFNGVTTADGRWLFSVSPITNSNGEMVALCEVGLNLVSYDEADSRVIREVLICVGSITVAVFLLLSELINLIAILRKYNKKKKESQNNETAVDFVRPFAFLIYMADNFTCVIIPLVSERMYNAQIPFSQEFATALPLAAQAFSTALMGLFAGRIIRHIGNRKVFITGIIMHIVGLSLCAAASSLYTFTVAMFIVGIGMGLNIVCMNTFIVQHDGEDSENSAGFSMFTTGMFGGTNCGIVVGTVISERSGYRLVFAISALVALFALAMVMFFYKKDITIKSTEHKEKSSISLSAFIMNFKVNTYFIFALIPYFIFASFVFYFVPIYADSQGITESQIGLITLVYGLITSYMSGFTTKNIVDRIGAGRSIVVASFITVLSLTVFIMNESVVSLIFVVMIMGVADSFGYPALSVYFSQLKAVEAYGDEKAMGIYNTFEGIAETIAPMIIGASLILGERMGMIVLGGGFAVCALIFMTASSKLFGKHKKEK